MYTREDILSDLDSNPNYEFFLDLEHGYFYTAGSRLNLFADENRWAIVFEKSGFGNRTGNAEIELNYLGNCMINPPNAGLNDQFISSVNMITIIDAEDLELIADGYELVSKKAETINVRGKAISIEQIIAAYQQREIVIREIQNPNRQIDFPALIRFLDEENRALFRATKNEITLFLPNDLPMIMSIDQWHHTRIYDYGGPKTSENETFQLIADILVSKDKSKWNPTLSPNNDWRYWPGAGKL